MRKGIILAIGGLVFLAGCGNQGDKASNVPVTPKWKGAAYHLAFDTQAAKPNPAGVTIPVIKYTANPDSLERRVLLVVRFDASAVTKQVLIINQIILPPINIAGADSDIAKTGDNVADDREAEMVVDEFLDHVSSALLLSCKMSSPRRGTGMAAKAYFDQIDSI